MTGLDSTPEDGSLSRALGPGDSSQVRAFVLAAFEQARAKKKRNWHIMTVPVLKNRILQLSGQSFNPRDYGATGMVDLASRLPDLLELDLDVVPPTVQLRSIDADARTAGFKTLDIQESARIRRDLFTAVLDYSSEGGYVWDSDAGLAVPASDGHGMRIPTVSSEELLQRKREFVERVSSHVDSAGAASIEVWAERQLPTHFLPKALQGAWNGELKSLVAERLQSAFAENGIEPPDDLITYSSRHEPSISNFDVSDAERLRALIVSVVGCMTLAELRAVQLPAGSIVRLGGGFTSELPARDLDVPRHEG